MPITLTLCVTVYLSDGLNPTQRERRLRVCVCERGEINTALIRMYGAQGPTSKCKEGGGKRRRNGP